MTKMRKYRKHINPRYFLAETAELHEENQPLKTVEETIAAIEAAIEVIQATTPKGQEYKEQIEWLASRSGHWQKSLPLLRQKIKELIDAWDPDKSLDPNKRSDSQQYEDLLVQVLNRTKGSVPKEQPMREKKEEKWIQSAEKDIKRRGTEGVCTGDKFGSESCPPGSKRYNLAKTFRKLAKQNKKK